MLAVFLIALRSIFRAQKKVSLSHQTLYSPVGWEHLLPSQILTGLVLGAQPGARRAQPSACSLLLLPMKRSLLPAITEALLSSPSSLVCSQALSLHLVVHLLLNLWLIKTIKITVLMLDSFTATSIVLSCGNTRELWRGLRQAAEGHCGLSFDGLCS